MPSHRIQKPAGPARRPRHLRLPCAARLPGRLLGSAGRSWAAAALAAIVLTVGCTTTSNRQTTVQALNGILDGSQRSEANRARDRYRHPKETLLFFGIRPEMSVMEVWPEPGWYTEILAPLLRDKGRYCAAVIAPDATSKYISERLESFQQKLSARPDLYDKVTVVTFPLDGSDAVPAGSLDMVVTFRNIHNWMSRDHAM